MVIKERDHSNALKVSCDGEGIEKASQIISQGGVAVFPTDTVYGIGCDPYNRVAVEKVYRIKSRDASKPLPVLTHSVEAAQRIAEFNELAKRIVERFWPGPLTIILKVTDEKIKESLNLTDKIAIRIPDHRCTLELLRRCDFLVGTSANVSGGLPHTNPEDCLKSLQSYDVFVDGGTIAGKGESTIIEIDNGGINLIRKGSLTKEEILQS